MEKTGLIVDDVEVSRFAVQLLLADLGISFLEADGVDQCLKVLSQHRPDFIIMDWHLRHDNGLDLVRKVRGLPSMMGVPIIVYSGVESSEGNDLVQSAGADAFLTKPLSVNMLKEILERLNLFSS